MRSHTPARCQSRRRRQHVIPDPHPSSCGSICQGMPLRRTNRMPVRHARSETRGRPPFGRRGGVGKNGSTRSHNGSGSSAAAIPVHATSPTRISSAVLLHALRIPNLRHVYARLGYVPFHHFATMAMPSRSSLQAAAKKSTPTCHDVVNVPHACIPLGQGAQEQRFAFR